MELKPISGLIDPDTRIAKMFSYVRGTKSFYCGYLVFVVNGELVQRRLYDMKWNAKLQSATYIVLKQVKYAVDRPAKPISGHYTVESLKV